MILKTYERLTERIEHGLFYCTIERVQLERHQDNVERRVIVACLASTWSGRSAAQARQNARRSRDRRARWESPYAPPA